MQLRYTYIIRLSDRVVYTDLCDYSGIERAFYDKIRQLERENVPMEDISRVKKAFRASCAMSQAREAYQTSMETADQNDMYEGYGDAKTMVLNMYQGERGELQRYATRCGVSIACITKWLTQSDNLAYKQMQASRKLPPKRKRPKNQDRPVDFDAVRQQMTYEQMAKHYDVSRFVIRRWATRA